MTKFRIKTPVYPTESNKKVKEAIKNLFPDIELEEKKRKEFDELVGYGDKEDLEEMREKILEQKISDTARNIILEKNYDFSLNKQAATVGKINFKEQGPLGTIEVNFLEKEKHLINWLAPKTKEGEPIQ